MMSTTHRLILGACLLAGRSVAFHVPAASSLSGQTRALRSSNTASLLRRKVHSGLVMQAGSMQETIEGRLNEALSPMHLEVINESHMHSGPAKESHFKVIVVTDQFEGKPLVARHRMVNALFADEMTGKTPAMHALSIQGKTPTQWESEGHKVVPSPPCMGGSKADPSMRGKPSALAASGRMQGGLFRGRRSTSLGLGAIVCRSAAGLLACCAVCLCFPGTAAAVAVAAAGKGARAGAGGVDSSAVGSALASVDNAFYSFAEGLGSLLDKQRVTSPLAQFLLLFNTAWGTTSTAPIAAAGVIGQPLGRAMVATASAHASFAALKFLMAMWATTQLPIVSVSRGSTRSRSDRSSRSRRPTPTVRKPMAGRRQLKFPAKSRRVRSDPLASVDIAKRATIRVRRSAKNVPRVWLMVVTAVGGPAMGAVLAAIAHRLGYIVMPAVMSSLVRGSVLGTFAAGSLCYGGAGTELAARWAVFQGVFGALFASLLSPSALMFVFFVRYYARAAGARGGGPGQGGGGGKTRMAGGKWGQGQGAGKEQERTGGEGESSEGSSNNNKKD